MIKWNEVTWYSRLAAIVFFFGFFPVLIFYIGMRYQQVMEDEATWLQESERIASHATDRSVRIVSKLIQEPTEATSTAAQIFSNSLKVHPELAKQLSNAGVEFGKISRVGSIERSFDIYLHGRKIGYVQGNTHDEASFSPNRKYLAFRIADFTTNRYDYSNQWVGVIDFTSKAFFVIPPPPVSYNGTEARVFFDQVDGYFWDNDGINVATHYAVQTHNPVTGFQRIAEPITWRYDLKRRAYDNTPDASDMSDWRTYSGNGFSVRYPFEGVVNTTHAYLSRINIAPALGVNYWNSCSSVCKPEDRFFFEVRTMQSTTTRTLEQWFVSLTSAPSIPAISQRKNVTINGEPGIYFEFPSTSVDLGGYNKVIVLTQHDGVQYIIYGSKNHAPYKLYDVAWQFSQKYAVVFDKMLDSFRFAQYLPSSDILPSIDLLSPTPTPAPKLPSEYFGIID